MCECVCAHLCMHIISFCYFRGTFKGYFFNHKTIQQSIAGIPCKTTLGTKNDQKLTKSFYTVPYAQEPGVVSVYVYIKAG